MPTEDNTKTPDEVSSDALDEQKVSPQEDQVATDFVKSAGDAQKIILDALPENTAKQKVFKTLMYVIISLSATLAVPCGSLAYSYGNEKAKRESETMKKKAEAENVRRKLQLDLLKQIIDVAKTAEFKDPKSVYRLGLIAAMVNENHAAFGIKLINAEQTMNSMSDKLAPIAGLRRRLRESGILMSDLQARYKDARKEEKNLKTRIKEINKILKVTKYMGERRKKKLEKELGEKENELDQQKYQSRFYQERLFAEQNIRKYFSTELKRQEKILKDTLRQTANLRSDLKKKSLEVSELAVKLEQESKSAKETGAKFKKALAEMQKDYGKSEQNNKRLRAELKSEQEASNNLKRLVKMYVKHLTQCKASKKKEAKAPSKKAPKRRVRSKVKRPTRAIKKAVRVQAPPGVRDGSPPPMKRFKTYLKRRRALDGLYAK